MTEIKGQWPLPSQSPCRVVFGFIYNCRHRSAQLSASCYSPATGASNVSSQEISKEDAKGSRGISEPWGCSLPPACQSPYSPALPAPDAHPSLGTSALPFPGGTAKYNFCSSICCSQRWSHSLGGGDSDRTTTDLILSLTAHRQLEVSTLVPAWGDKGTDSLVK